MPTSQKPSTSVVPKKMKKVCSPTLPQVEELAKRTQMRKVRIICTDPDATESSSDEQEVCSVRNKRVVREMFIPAASRPWHNSYDEAAEDSCSLPPNIQDCELLHTPASSPLSFSKNLGRCSSKRSSKTWRLRHASKSKSEPQLCKSEKNCSRYIGVRQRRWGKWTAEFREASQGVRMWLGTFDSAKEAAIAYDDAARQLKGDEAVTNFAGSLDTHCSSLECWPGIGMSSDELLSCPELDGMEDCFLAYSPSSVLDLPTSLDSASPSSVLDITFSDECGSPPHQLKDAEEQAEVGVGNRKGFGTCFPEKCLKSEPSIALEPLFEAFRKFCDNEVSLMGNEDGLTCHEFASLGDFSEDEGANLSSFELDAEALTWIDIQP